MEKVTKPIVLNETFSEKLNVINTQLSSIAQSCKTISADVPKVTTGTSEDGSTTITVINKDGTTTTTKLVDGTARASVNTLSARMDTFTSLPEGSTSGNAELADIRVGADGTTYDTAGNAVRGQISELKSDLNKEVSDRNNAITAEKNARDEAIKNEQTVRSQAIFDAVNEEKNRAITRENEIEALFTLPTQDAVNNWLNEHPEATTTVQDGSITVSKLNKETKNYIRASINVKDFGAVGDGITDDKDAIINAFNYAIEHLPCEVYFPAGVYGILRGGITVRMPLGSGGLSVRGDGYNLSQIKYLKDWETDNTWYAIRIQPVTTPTNDIEFLHDVVISDISVYDTDPITHAWDGTVTEKNPTGLKEETHGFDIQYCNRVTVSDCAILSVGDEAIDIYYCRDVTIANNHIYNSPGAGNAGGAISIGDGSKNVSVIGNTINYTREDKSNFGIAVESLFYPVTDVVITGNVITDINGNGINVGATNEGAYVHRVSIGNNVINNCVNGIVLIGAYIKNDIAIIENIIANCSGYGIEGKARLGNTLISTNVIDSTQTAISVTADYTVNISGCNIYNTKGQAIYSNATKCIVDGCIIDGVGISDNSPVGAILRFEDPNIELIVKSTCLRNVNMNKGIHGAKVVENSDIILSGIGDSISGTVINKIVNVTTNGRINIPTNNAIVTGLKIESTESLGSNAITISNATGVLISGCNISVPDYSSIKESGTADYNLITCNVSNRGITKLGANTVDVNNILIT